MPGRKRICFVTASPLTVKAFLGDQIAALAREHDITVVTHLDDGERLDALEGVARVLSVPIERRVIPLRDLAALARLVRLFRESPDVAILLELMTDFDEGLQEWRYRHVKMVERTIGNKKGTGGSAGAEYLRATLFRPVFPDLWAIRQQL